LSFQRKSVPGTRLASGRFTGCRFMRCRFSNADLREAILPEDLLVKRPLANFSRTDQTPAR
jgi:uncharacterized protein YjbI with pentapeptide repeats